MIQCNEFYCDGTYSSSPRKYNMLFNIIAYHNSTNSYIPVIHALMSGQTEGHYVKVLEYLKLKKEKSEIKSIMCDFEKALRNAIKNIFPNVIIYGCYYHFVKLLFKHLKKKKFDD